MTELNKLSAVAAAAEIAAGRISSEDLTRACLARIDERESDVRAWTWLSPEQAIATAFRPYLQARDWVSINRGEVVNIYKPTDS